LLIEFFRRCSVEQNSVRLLEKELLMPFGSEADLIFLAQRIANENGYVWDRRLERIIRFWLGPPTAFPPLRRRTVLTIKDVDAQYVSYFITRYFREREGVVLMRPVSTKSDPAVDEVITAYENIDRQDLPRICKAHRLSMQAENIVGKLLERYVARLLESKGWVWCAGETVRSVDFITGENGRDVKLLQIKNRSNSENSSSSAVRNGTTIKKWHRINSTTGTTRWHLLPENEDDTCTEEGFYEFVRKEAQRGPLIEQVPLTEVVAGELFDARNDQQMSD
jgi:hypothetical protein